MSDTVRYESGGGIATITLDRPEALNSLTVESKEALLASLERARDDAHVRAVILTGSGRAFCAGQDLQEHAAALDRGTGLMDTVRLHYNPIVTTLTGMAKPVVAAVNGMAAGAGAALAFAADLRVAAQSASFLMAFSGVGLGPDTGASWTLQRLVGRGRASEMLLLGERVSSERALEWGMVNKVVPDWDLMETAGALAARLAAGPTLAYAGIKEALEVASSRGFEEALRTEADVQERLAATADHRNATAAFVAKRRPTFEGR
ncbi:enoyl-CoA hydratase-related protein [Allonocardiopsis opalescens]|uniref:2-(1,2-epoxy-1,2-dihydrophenyl)acetyl-CoA isomerase n=1 Tax=Allonocardiopsis opalescens TaxID=1144618 RepID=A0A2T0QDG9_9ACTN|nr:enoyl-CoA hydratase-related protein [Allonocardiopsis opalescens]PRY01969.1 2-(1,2-epoxy-1,2-dihydrophenyl)acetyl-CoA isomerase [Allonocardiopsis opalescens]